MTLSLRGRENAQHERFLPLNNTSYTLAIHPEPCYRSSGLQTKKNNYGGTKTATFRQLASFRETGHELRPQLARGRPRALTTAEEDALIAYATTLFHGRFPAFISMLEDAANSLRSLRTPSCGPVGQRWIARWLADHRVKAHSMS